MSIRSYRVSNLIIWTCVASYVEFCLFDKLQVDFFLHFWLDSCIVHKGEKFELELACCMHLEGFQVVSSLFWALVCTGLNCRGHRSDRSECWPYSHVAHRFDRWW
jgi:hypothetical protein